MKLLKTLLLAVTFTIFTLPAAFAQIGATWTSVTGLPADRWLNCASSTNAAKLVIDGIDASNHYALYTSTNSGATWTYQTNLAGCIVSSADGTTLALAAANNQIYISTNSGVTWNPTGVGSPFGTLLAGSWDGRIIMAPSLAVISTNSGATWTPLSKQGYSGACSSDGTKLAVGVNNDTVYISTNSGATWMSSSLPTNPQWQSLAMSADGNTLIACTEYDLNDATGLQRGEFYFSTDTGTSWTEANYESGGYSFYLNYWTSVAISADGRTMVAASTDGAAGDIPGLLLVSTNYGANWEPASVPTAYFRYVNLSADGTGMMALSYDSHGGSYAYMNIGNSAGTPALNISTAGGSALLSWPFLTPGYVLQQNTNLATPNWVTVTNAPAVVNQVITAPAGPNNFYRLAKP